MHFHPIVFLIKRKVPNNERIFRKFGVKYHKRWIRFGSFWLWDAKTWISSLTFRVIRSNQVIFTAQFSDQKHSNIRVEIFSLLDGFQHTESRNWVNCNQIGPLWNLIELHSDGITNVCQFSEWERKITKNKELIGTQKAIIDKLTCLPWSWNCDE